MYSEERLLSIQIQTYMLLKGLGCKAEGVTSSDHLVQVNVLFFPLLFISVQKMVGCLKTLVLIYQSCTEKSADLSTVCSVCVCNINSQQHKNWNKTNQKHKN